LRRRLSASGLATGLLLLALPAVPAAATGGASWIEQSSANPPQARTNAAAAQDATGGVVVFGGLDDNEADLADTWRWRDGAWSQLSPTLSPGGRDNAAMAYDPTRGVDVLFGGNDGAALDDTWTWDGSDWTQQQPTVLPPAGVGVTAYDAALGGVVLFIGSPNPSTPARTFLWTGSNWEQLSTTVSPPGLFGDAMAADPAGGVMIFGGELDQLPGGESDQTWVLKGTTWVLATSAQSPPARQSEELATDLATGQVVMFGGTALGVLQDDTWTWDGATWRQQNPSSSPDPAYAQPFAYDASIQQMLLLDSFSSDAPATWTFTPNPPGVSEAPIITGTALRGIRPVYATIDTTINPNGLPTTAEIVYGLTTAYGSVDTLGSVGSGAVGVAVTGSLGGTHGLLPGRLYHYRVIATNTFGESEPLTTPSSQRQSSPPISSPGTPAVGSGFTPELVPGRIIRGSWSESAGMR
jgi:hypothetical protein